MLKLSKAIFRQYHLTSVCRDLSLLVAVVLASISTLYLKLSQPDPAEQQLPKETCPVTQPLDITGKFTHSFVEHGYIIGLMNIRADITYQQGLNKMWSRRTRYDFYWPSFAHLGEQPVYNREIYTQNTTADDSVFGYQERYAEYRYKPSEITGYFRSTAASTIDVWHLSEKFTTLPALNDTFIGSSSPFDRVVAVAAPYPQFLVDMYFDYKSTRPMPVYSVPGFVDHF